MPSTTARFLSLAAPVLALLGACDPAIDATDDADLAPLKAAIGDARVVQIGEPSHGE